MRTEKMEISSITIVLLLAFTFSFDEFSQASFIDHSAFKGSISTYGKSESDYPSLAKYSLEEAVSTAVSTTNGKVIEAALESESGFLVYEVEITMPNKTQKEIFIDAGTGEFILTSDDLLKTQKIDEQIERDGIDGHHDVKDNANNSVKGKTKNKLSDRLSDNLRDKGNYQPNYQTNEKPNDKLNHKVAGRK